MLILYALKAAVTSDFKAIVSAEVVSPHSGVVCSSAAHCSPLLLKHGSVDKFQGQMLNSEEK